MSCAMTASPTRTTSASSPGCFPQDGPGDGHRASAPRGLPPARPGGALRSRAVELLEGRISLIPTKLEECPVPARLKKWQAVDVFANGGFERLLATQWLTQVLLPSRLPGVTVPEVKNLEEVSPMIAEHAIDWTKPWREAGLREGREEGREEGRREGEATLLLQMLSLRFGPLSSALEELVRSASDEQLFDWGRRFVTATNLGEIFNGLQLD